ncbi:MAG: response regulator [Aphanothece sp. CMT-3BRIN-NPC111]|jgi:signal transduction histidine kinase|nr:response regulator [Aphanothece sp. CMT-3BRIN-NPC111]
MDSGINIVSTQKYSALVLVVDDDRLLRMQLSCFMKEEGYQVVEAADGEQALAAYARFNPDVILLDGLMPVMDGFTCCAKLQTLPGGSNTPILMITALDDAESVAQAFSTGATDYITKPIHWEVLRQRVRRILQASWAMEELRQQSLKQREALAKERELSELKSRFISVASHEFRTPLTTIMSAAECLEHYRNKWAEDKQIAYLHRIQYSVKHMTELLNDVLTCAKANAEKIEFNPAPIELVEFCHQLTEEMQLGAHNQHQILYICCSDCSGQPLDYAHACMDEKLLRHILNNLLSNAIKYSPKGSTIYFKLACEEGKAIFYIQDQGIGIPPEDIPRLFENFHRSQNVGTIPGTGLGLAIVKNSVDIHGGRITVCSAVGMGTTFKVELPLNYQL